MADASIRGELAGIFVVVRDMTCPFPKDVKPRNIG
jgi:hypothetical protein